MRDRILALFLKRDLEGLGHYIFDEGLLEQLGLPTARVELELLRNRVAGAVFTSVRETIVNDPTIRARLGLEAGLELYRLATSALEDRSRPRALSAAMHTKLVAARFDESQVRFGDLVRVAYGAMQGRSTLDRNALALSVARAARGAPRLSAHLLDECAGMVIERLSSSEWGGRSFTYGTFLALLHPEAGNDISFDSANQLMTAVRQMLGCESALNRELPLLLAGFVAWRFRDRAPDMMDVVEHYARQAHQDSSTIHRRVCAVLLHWLSHSSDGLVQYYRLQDLDDLIVRPLRTDSFVPGSAQLAEMSARQIATKPLGERTSEDVVLYDDCIRHLASTTSDVWALARTG